MRYPSFERPLPAQGDPENCADTDSWLNDVHATAAMPVTDGLAGVGKVVTPESEAILKSACQLYHVVKWKQTVFLDVAVHDTTTSQTLRWCGRMCGTHHTPSECGLRTHCSVSRYAGHWPST